MRPTGLPPFLLARNGRFRHLLMTDHDSMTNLKTDQDIRVATHKLLAYCQASDWAGYDPYDAVNSKLFAAVPLLNSRIPRLALTQLLKRLPVNIRPLLAIPKTQNPKGLALFLSAFTKLRKMGEEDGRELDELIAGMIDRLAALRSTGVAYSCWGYSFPWQTRTIIVPSGTPNLVCTTFAANALLDAYDYCHDSRCLEMAASATEYVLNELYWTDGTRTSFNYPLPSVRSEVHNANFLAAALLGRAYSHTGNKRFIGLALQAARCSAGKQQADGSWYYGEAFSQRWIDNFHTGYNLCALRVLSRYASTTEFDAVIQRGFEFYRAHFFGADGVARYFHDRTYPIDIHSVAQSIITLATFKDTDPGSLQLARGVLTWAMTHMWDDRGYFYYRILRSHTNRISYMRWSQAWMLLAMVTFQEASAPVSSESFHERLAEVAQ